MGLTDRDIGERDIVKREIGETVATGQGHEVAAEQSSHRRCLRLPRLMELLALPGEILVALQGPNTAAH